MQDDHFFHDFILTRVDSLALTVRFCLLIMFII